MNMIRTSIVLILLLVAIQSFGQEFQSKPSISDRFPGGADTLRKYLAMHARFPAPAAELAQSGLSVASITITPNGTIHQISIYNSLGEYIDDAVVRVLNKTDGRWLPVQDYPDLQTFYSQIYFQYDDSGFDGHPTLKGDSILDEIFLGVGDWYPPNYQKGPELKKDLEKFMAREKYIKALDALDECIRRNPFNREYYEMQMECYEGLGMSEAREDVMKRLETSDIGSELSLLNSPITFGNIKIINQLKNGSYSIKELTIDSVLLYSGTFLSINPEIRQGKFYFFHENGKIATTGQYQNDVPVGTWNYFSEQGEVEASLDYSSVIKFMLEEEANPLIDSTFMGREDLMVNDDGSIVIAEKMPRFNGGDPVITFREYVVENLKYPPYAGIKGFQGRVILQFTIDKEGRVREPVVIRGVHKDLNLEAVRVCVDSPLWTPASVEGKNVNVTFTYPIKFNLSD